MTLHLLRQDGTSGLAASRRLMEACGALLLGAFILLGVGFAPVGVIHNAAHDTRHSFAFPCH
jgi:cobalt transporter subunit CbtB